MFSSFCAVYLFLIFWLQLVQRTEVRQGSCSVWFLSEGGTSEIEKKTVQQIT